MQKQKNMSNFAFFNVDIIIIFSILIKEKTDHYYRNYLFLHISFQLKRMPHFNIWHQRGSVLEVKYSTK